MEMPYIVEVLEIVNSQGSGIGKWRLTTRVDGGKPQALCAHQHDSYDEAWNCIEAWLMAKKVSGDSIKSKSLSLKLGSSENDCLKRYWLIVQVLQSIQ